jgi:hypothetical protein
MDSFPLFYFVSFTPLLCCTSFLFSTSADENLMHVSGNVNGACKILILKFSVGMIVVQNLIEQILYTTGTMDIHSNDRYSAEQRAERALCNCHPSFLPSIASLFLLSCYLSLPHLPRAHAALLPLILLQALLSSSNTPSSLSLCIGSSPLISISMKPQLWHTLALTSILRIVQRSLGHNGFEMF